MEGRFHGMLLLSPKCSRPPGKWENTVRTAFPKPFNGLVIPFGAMVEYHPVSAKDIETASVWDNNLAGFFPWIRLQPITKSSTEEVNPDTIIVNCYSIVEQDSATQWIQSYPCRTKLRKQK